MASSFLRPKFLRSIRSISTHLFTTPALWPSPHHRPLAEFVLLFGPAESHPCPDRGNHRQQRRKPNMKTDR